MLRPAKTWKEAELTIPPCARWPRGCHFAERDVGARIAKGMEP